MTSCVDDEMVRWIHGEACNPEKYFQKAGFHVEKSKVVFLEFTVKQIDGENQAEEMLLLGQRLERNGNERNNWNMNFKSFCHGS